MFNSKALKDSNKEPSKLYLWWIQSAIGDWYYDFTWKWFGNPWFQFKRLCSWYINVFCHDFDFDAHSIYGVLEYKLKRIQNVLINGHSIQEEQDLHALALAIKLATRLKEDRYEERASERIEHKWGKLEIDFVDLNDGSNCSRMISSRPKMVTDEDKEQEWKETKEQYELAYIRKARETKWLFAILAKYIERLWD